MNHANLSAGDRCASGKGVCLSLSAEESELPFQYTVNSNAAAPWSPGTAAFQYSAPSPSPTASSTSFRLGADDVDGVSQLTSRANRRLSETFLEGSSKPQEQQELRVAGPENSPGMAGREGAVKRSPFPIRQKSGSMNVLSSSETVRCKKHGLFSALLQNFNLSQIMPSQDTQGGRELRVKEVGETAPKEVVQGAASDRSKNSDDIPSVPCKGDICQSHGDCYKIAQERRTVGDVDITSHTCINVRKQDTRCGGDAALVCHDITSGPTPLKTGQTSRGGGAREKTLAGAVYGAEFTTPSGCSGRDVKSCGKADVSKSTNDGSASSSSSMHMSLASPISPLHQVRHCNFSEERSI